MPNYARAGRRVEHDTRHVLDGNGYWTIRSAASKGDVDIIAMKPGQVLFVQCKRSGSLPPAEWNALWALAIRLGAIPVLAQVKLAPRRVVLHRLTAPKDGTPRRQPMEPFAIDEPGDAPAMTR